MKDNENILVYIYRRSQCLRLYSVENSDCCEIWIGKEAVTWPCSETVPAFAGRSEGNNETSQWVQLVSRPRFEPITSRIQSRCFTAWVSFLGEWESELHLGSNLRFRTLEINFIHVNCRLRTFLKYVFLPKRYVLLHNVSVYLLCIDRNVWTRN